MPEFAPVVPAAVAPTSVAPSADTSDLSAAPNRRHLFRLRDLCDEVLASFRVAHDSEVISDVEREDAQAALAGVSPRRA